MFGERVGFLKFKADILDKETGKKVFNHIYALLLNGSSIGFILYSGHFNYVQFVFFRSSCFIPAMSNRIALLMLW